MPYDPTLNPYILNPLELPSNQTAAGTVPARNKGTAQQWSQSPYYLPNWGRQNQPANNVASQATSPVATAAIGWPDAIIEDRDICAKAALNAEKTRVSALDTGLQGQITALNALIGGAPFLASVTPNTGPAAGGTTGVVLQGATLTGATGVTFGGTAATAVVVADDGRVTCTTPAHAAGAVNVIITTAGGSSTLTNGFTYF